MDTHVGLEPRPTQCLQRPLPSGLCGLGAPGVGTSSVEDRVRTEELVCGGDSDLILFAAACLCRGVGDTLYVYGYQVCFREAGACQHAAATHVCAIVSGGWCAARPREYKASA